MSARTMRHGSSPPGRPLRRGLTLALVALALAATAVLAQSGTVYDLHWNVVTGGGAFASGSTYRIHYSYGQPSTVGYSTGTTYIAGQGFWLGEPMPTAVKLVSFTAGPYGAEVLVAWETASEYDNLGFHLYRQAGREGPVERLNQALIPSRAPGQGQGAAYTFVDGTARAGVGYLYILEDVDVNGRRTAHGPVPATAPYGVFLPLVGR